MTTASAQGVSFVSSPVPLHGDLNGFKKWANPLIDLIARTQGVRVSILKAGGKGQPSIVLYGEQADVDKVRLMIYALVESRISPIFKGVCSALKADGRRTSGEYAYSAAFYHGFISAFGDDPRTREAVAANTARCEEIGRRFPAVNQPYPTHKGHDLRIVAKGVAAYHATTLVPEEPVKREAPQAIAAPKVALSPAPQTEAKPAEAQPSPKAKKGGRKPKVA